MPSLVLKLVRLALAAATREVFAGRRRLEARFDDDAAVVVVRGAMEAHRHMTHATATKAGMMRARNDRVGSVGGRRLQQPGASQRPERRRM